MVSERACGTLPPELRTPSAELLLWGSTYATSLALYERDSIPDEGSEGHFNVAYLEIPLLAEVMVPLSADSRVSPHLIAGPSIALELSCGISGTISGITVSSDCDAPDLGIERKTTDIGLIFGGGIEIQAGPGARRRWSPLATSSPRHGLVGTNEGDGAVVGDGAIVGLVAGRIHES